MYPGLGQPPRSPGLWKKGAAARSWAAIGQSTLALRGKAGDTLGHLPEAVTVRWHGLALHAGWEPVAGL